MAFPMLNGLHPITVERLPKPVLAKKAAGYKG
jgi:hypothetical protein